MNFFLSMLLKLIMGHALADFVLQTEFIAVSKNRNTPPKYLDAAHLPVWPYTLTAHALINAAVVWLITNSLLFASIELITHWLIDFLKCDKVLNLHEDQAFHIILKLIYSAFLFGAAL